MLYWNCCLIRTCCLLINEENSKFFWSNLQIISLPRHFVGVNLSKFSQVCHMNIYGSNYLTKHWQAIHFFQKKHGKHDDHTMIVVWIMENMVIIPWSCHKSWQPRQETWSPCRHHGMIMTMFHHDHGKIMAWQPCFPTQDFTKLRSRALAS